MDSMGNYLGVPLLGKSPRQQDFNYLIDLIDKVKEKLSGWKAIKCLNNDLLGSLSGRNLVRKIKQLLSSFTSVRIIHTYCEANRVADSLTNIGCTLGDGLVVYLPLEVKLLVEADVRGVSIPRLIPV